MKMSSAIGIEKLENWLIIEQGELARAMKSGTWDDAKGAPTNQAAWRRMQRTIGKCEGRCAMIKALMWDIEKRDS
tara:strand:- start:260 stop:484 length:225 start_codon:yes stop_codon:yes gene_type:complete